MLLHMFVPFPLLLFHREELPTEFTKETTKGKERDPLIVFPVDHFNGALSKPFNQAAFGLPAFLWVRIDKEPFSPRAVAACGVLVANCYESAHMR